MERKVKIGETIQHGKTENVYVSVAETDKSITVTGEKPFGGKPMAFIPMPEGYEGVTPIHQTNSLSEMVKVEERTIFKMGSNPNCFYQYEDGYCIGYHGIREIKEK